MIDYDKYVINYDVFNQNLHEVEEIISSHYHFRFIDIFDDDISPADLMLNVVQARVILEGICRYIILKKHLVTDEKSIKNAHLRDYIDKILAPHLIIPDRMMPHFREVQNISNTTVHYQIGGNIDLRSTIMCLTALDAIFDWFIKGYGNGQFLGSEWTISSDMLSRNGAVPLKAEGCVLSRQKEIKEIRNIIVNHRIIVLKGDVGVGKTELVKDYVKKFRRNYDRVYYTEYIDEIDSFLWDLPVGIMDQDFKTKEEIISEKLEKIHSMEFKYLFIIDNYTGNLDDLNRMIPNGDDKYHLMVITGKDFLVNEEICDYEVRPFTKEQSLQIFRYFCETKFEDNDVLNLLSDLAFNPRAIRMSAIFLSDNDFYSPQNLIDIIKHDSSIKSIMNSLYTVLTNVSVLEDDNAKLVAQCLSLIPYTGFEKYRFIQLINSARGGNDDDRFVEEAIEKLNRAGWMNVEDIGIIYVNPFLSDILFEKTKPDLDSEIIFKFVMPILAPIKKSRELLIGQIIALKPFVDQLLKRIETVQKCNLNILNEVREYYISVFDVPKIELVSMLMEKEFLRRSLDQSTIVENSVYRLGISWFSLEDYENAHIYFSKALTMLNKKQNDVEEMIARVLAYESSSLASLGNKEEAIECAKRSITIRNNMAKLGNTEAKIDLWISHYNYAKVLLQLEMFDDALREIDIATNIFIDYYREIYYGWESAEGGKPQLINVSSLFQLRGRILSGLNRYDEAIQLLENALTIRKRIKGEKYFGTAQIYSYLMEVHSVNKNYEQALKCAQLYYDVLLLQTKTNDIQEKIRYTEEKIIFYKERINNVEFEI